MSKRLQGVDAYCKNYIQLFSAGLVLAVGLIHTGLAYVLYFGSMNGLRAQSIALLSYIDPVSALVFSAVLLSEPLSPLGLAGACLIIGSAIASELGPEA